MYHTSNPCSRTLRSAQSWRSSTFQRQYIVQQPVAVILPCYINILMTEPRTSLKINGVYRYYYRYSDHISRPRRNNVYPSHLVSARPFCPRPQ